MKGVDMFVIFNQNNSGGYFHVNDDEAHNVVIEGDSLKDIVDKALDILDNSDSCPCCGDRWYLDVSERDCHDTWMDKVAFNHFDRVVIVHYKSGKRVRYEYKRSLQLMERSEPLDRCKEMTVKVTREGKCVPDDEVSKL